MVVGGGCFGEVWFALVEDVEDGDGVSEAVVAAAELDACAGGFGLAAEEVETDAAGVVLEVVACELGDGFGGGLVLLFAAEAGVVDDEDGFEFEEDALESGSRGLGISARGGGGGGGGYGGRGRDWSWDWGRSRRRRRRRSRDRWRPDNGRTESDGDICTR